MTLEEAKEGESTLTQTKQEHPSAREDKSKAKTVASVKGSSRSAKNVSPVGELILGSLAAKELTQTDLARLLAGPVAEPSRVENVRRLVQKWIRGDNDPSLAYAAKLASVLAIDPLEVAATLHGGAATQSSASEPDQEALEFARQAAEAMNPDALRPDIRAPLSHADLTNHFPQFNAQGVLIDQVDELIPESYVRARKRVQLDDWGLKYWWKSESVIPAVMLQEMLSQSAAIGLLAKGKNQQRVVFTAATNIRYRRIVRPGDEVFLEAAIVHLAGSIAHVDVVAKVEGEVAVRGRLTLAIH